jgi:hypothetical protein
MSAQSTQSTAANPHWDWDCGLRQVCAEVCVAYRLETPHATSGGYDGAGLRSRYIPRRGIGAADHDNCLHWLSGGKPCR